MRVSRPTPVLSRPVPSRRGAAAHPLGVAAHLIGPRPGRLDALMAHQRCHQVPQQVQARPRAEPEPPVYAAMRDGGRHRQPHPARPSRPPPPPPGRARAPRSPPGTVVRATEPRGPGTGRAGHLERPPCSNRAVLERTAQERLHAVLECSDEGDAAASPGNLFQCSATPSVKKFFLLFKWNFLRTSFCSLCRVPVLGTTGQSLLHP